MAIHAVAPTVPGITFFELPTSNNAARKIHNSTAAPAEYVCSTIRSVSRPGMGALPIQLTMEPSIAIQHRPAAQ